MCNNVAARPSAWERRLRAFLAVLAVLCMAAAFQISAAAQDQDDPPGRVARLGYMQGSVSFQPAGENDVETLDLAALPAQQLAGTQLPDGTVGDQPFQLGAGRGAEGFMFRQPIDEILCYHRRDISQSKPDYCLTTYQRGKRVCSLLGAPVLES